jgi:DNA-3-methyladenine glycosylase I
MKPNSTTLTRCPWASNDISIRYHDEEWGTPTHDDATLFEFLVLEGAQAGLSWDTILKKRENYRAALEGFDPVKIAAYKSQKIQALMQNAGIIRNRLKIASTIQNAKAFLKVQAEFDSLDAYIWQFVGSRPIVNRWSSAKQVPASTSQSDAMSKDLKKRGFSFVGTTICYAFMQAVGMVNDHLTTCFRHSEVAAKPQRR